MRPLYGHYTGIFSTQANIVQYCIQSGILQKTQQCLSSRSDMCMINSDDFVDGFCWTCPSCPDNRHSIRHDSILHNIKASLSPFLQILLHNCNTLSISQTAKQESLCPKTVRIMFAAIRHCMIDDLLINPTLLGGPGKIVEFDESLIGSRKYNRERNVQASREVAARRCRAREQRVLYCGV